MAADAAQAVVPQQALELGEADGARAALGVAGELDLVVVVAGEFLEDPGEAERSGLVAQGVELDAEPAGWQQPAPSVCRGGGSGLGGGGPRTEQGSGGGAGGDAEESAAGELPGEFAGALGVVRHGGGLLGKVWGWRDCVGPERLR